jgi:hypothetical protein
MTGDPKTLSAARAGVAHAVAAEPGRLRRCSAAGLLAFTSAAALAPLLVTGGPALAMAALAGVAGNVGSGMLSTVLDRAIARLAGAKPGPGDTDAIRDDLAGELRSVLQRQDAAAEELTAGLFDLLTRIGGVEAAIDAAADDISDNVLVCFRQLAGQQGEALSKLQAIEAGQRRQEWRQRDHGRQIEEMNDRLRLVLGLLADRLDGPAAPLTGGPGFIQLAGPAAGPALGISGWQGGAEVIIGDRAYLLHDEFLEERSSPDHSVLYRQARGLRLVPRGGRDDEHAWLRQAYMASTPSQSSQGQFSPAARAALAALRGERDLLARLRSVRGLPRITQLVADGRTATLVLGWPATRSGAPCDTLSTRLDGGPMDAWRMSRLFAGLAALCRTLARLHEGGVAHRLLTPSGIVVLDDGRLALRDAGLAACSPEPGEGPADYQAPEQRSGGRGRPGPATDCYQLAAVAYHLVAGHPPHPRVPLPLLAQAPGVPDRVSTALGAALTSDPAQRPGLPALARMFHAAADDLS